MTRAARAMALILSLALALTACGPDGQSGTGFIPEAQAAKPVPPPPPTQVNGWYAGPIIGTFNYSSISLMPPVGTQVLQFDLPVGQEVDALARPTTTLPASLSISYELLGTVTPSGANEPALISIAFQRKGDNWSGKNAYQQYRWYAQAAQVLVPGTNTFTVDFTSGAWSDVYGQPASAHPAEFAAAKTNVETVYITFGFSAGRMHGVLGPAHFNLLSAN